MIAKAHPGTILSVVGVVVLIVGLAVQANALIVIGFVAAVAGAILGGSRKASRQD